MTQLIHHLRHRIDLLLHGRDVGIRGCHLGHVLLEDLIARIGLVEQAQGALGESMGAIVYTYLS